MVAVRTRVPLLGATNPFQSRIEDGAGKSMIWWSLDAADLFEREG